MEKISVIVPVYNTEAFLDNCIKSILDQSHSALELILVNDGSTDRSGAICEQYAATDPRVIVLHKENGGQATARNMALDIATGDYIGFVDSDDFILPDMYETMLQSIKRTDADIAVCARFNVYEDGLRQAVFSLEAPLVMDRKEAIKRLLVYNGIDSSPCDKLFKRVLFDGIRYPSGYICEDVGVVYRVLNRATKIVHCAQPFYCYFQRQGSTSNSSFTERSKGLELFHKKASEDIKSWYPEFTEEADYFYYSRMPVLYTKMLQCRFSGDYKEYIRSIITAGIKCTRSNSHFSKKERIMMVLIRYRLYDVIWKVLKSRKWRKPKR